MPNLFPTFDLPDCLVSKDVTDRPDFKPSVFFDFDGGDFSRNAGKLICSSGYDAWVQWCTKMLSTPRYDCLAYSDQLGLEIPAELSSLDHHEAQMLLEKTITDALIADPSNRTKSVEDFEFSWDKESVTVSCTIVAADGATAFIQTTY